MPPIRKRAGPSKHRLPLKQEDLQRVVHFINNHREDYVIVLPGRHPGHQHFGGKLLTSRNKSSRVTSLQGIDDNTWYVKHKHILII